MEINGVGSNYYLNPTPAPVSTSTEKEYFIDTEVGSEGQENVNIKDLDKAVNKLNKFLEDDRTHAEYSVHEELNTLMIKIIDDVTKEVIMEVPPKKILDMVASMCKQFGLLDKKA